MDGRYGKADVEEDQDAFNGRDGVSALNRVMRLQKRADRSTPKPHEKGDRG